MNLKEEFERRFKNIAVTPSPSHLHEFHLVVQHDDSEDMKEIAIEILEAEFYLLIGGCNENSFKFTYNYY